jgi:hypothetical protein
MEHVVSREKCDYRIVRWLREQIAPAKEGWGIYSNERHGRGEKGKKFQ